jgi:hypothetical protein
VLLIYRSSAKQLFGRAGVGEVAAAIAADGGEGLKQVMRDAVMWVHAAIAAIRQAPNAGKGWQDEEMAGEILNRLDARKPQSGKYILVRPSAALLKPALRELAWQWSASEVVGGSATSCEDAF